MNAVRLLTGPFSSNVDLKRILVVDDETGFLLALKKILEGPAVSVDTAETVEAAMALLAEREYHVVIADVMLATILHEEGFEILRYVKGNKPGTKVIIVTGFGNSDILKKAVRMGADMFFEKPVSSRILMNALQCWGIDCHAG